MRYGDDVHSWVKTCYGEVRRGAGDLKAGACCAGAAPLTWLAARLANVHEDVAARGWPLAPGRERLNACRRRAKVERDPDER